MLVENQMKIGNILLHNSASNLPFQWHYRVVDGMTEHHAIKEYHYRCIYSKLKTNFKQNVIIYIKWQTQAKTV